jgi:hypothetical protein
MKRADAWLPKSDGADLYPGPYAASRQVFVAFCDVIPDRVAAMKTSLFLAKVDIKSTILNSMDLRVDGAPQIAVEVQRNILGARTLASATPSTRPLSALPRFPAPQKPTASLASIVKRRGSFDPHLARAVALVGVKRSVELVVARAHQFKEFAAAAFGAAKRVYRRI